LLRRLRRRVDGVALGDEDLNGRAISRNDPALKTGVDRDQAPASAPTQCRLENRAGHRTARAMHEVRMEAIARLSLRGTE
jgi:hypothetical protein